MAILIATAISRVLAILVAASSLAFISHGEVPWTCLTNGAGFGDHFRREVAKVHGAFIVAGPAPSKAQQLYAVQHHHMRHHFSNRDADVQKRDAESNVIDVILGGLFFAMAVCVLWLNEGHAVRMDRLFALAARRLRTVGGGSTDPENLRELVFTMGKTVTSDCLELKDWGGLAAPAGSAKVRATLWMYQWVEKKKNSAGDITCEYTTQWVDHQVNSRSFRHPDGHKNPQAPQPFRCEEHAACSLGDFALSRRMLGLLQAWRPCNLKGRLKELLKIPSLSGYKHPELTVHEGRQAVFLKLSGTPASPKVGDLMVCFEHVDCGITSILGIQVAHKRRGAPWTMVPLQYVSHNSYDPRLSRAETRTTNLGDAKHETLLGESEAAENTEERRDYWGHLRRAARKAVEGYPNPFKMADKFMTAACPDELLVVVEKEVTPGQAFAGTRAFERKMTTTMRLIGFTLMYISAESIFAPLKSLLSHFWMFGALLVLSIHAFTCMCACSCSAFTVSCAYLAYRPLCSALWIAYGIAIWYLVWRFWPEQPHV